MGSLVSARRHGFNLKSCHVTDIVNILKFMRFFAAHWHAEELFAARQWNGIVGDDFAQG